MGKFKFSPKHKTRTWMLTRFGMRLFEVTLPAGQLPVWEPPLETDRFQMQECELFLDGRLVAKGGSWAEVLAKAASKR